MHCYLIKNGHIADVEMLEDGPNEDLVKQAEDIFSERASEGIEGVEVWRGKRFIYRSPPVTE